MAKLAPYASWLPEAYSEADIARVIVEAALEKLKSITKVDVVVVGAGPAGLVCSWLLAESGLKVVVLEHYLGTGGGMRGGSMLLPVAVVEEGPAIELLRKAGVRLREYVKGLYIADPTELAAKLTAKAVDAGAVFLPGYHVEDLIVSEKDGELRVRGVVINLSPAIEAGWHIDPFYVESRAVVDATGHDAYLARILSERYPGRFKVPGMASLDLWRGEREVVEYAGELVPGLYLAGMSVAVVHNKHRMGPVFAGMFVSAIKVANLIREKLGGKKEAC